MRQILGEKMWKRSWIELVQIGSIYGFYTNNGEMLASVPYRTVTPLPFDFHSVARLPHTFAVNGNCDANCLTRKETQQI
jgi:hypothetical protein